MWRRHFLAGLLAALTTSCADVSVPVVGKRCSEDVGCPDQTRCALRARGGVGTCVESDAQAVGVLTDDATLNATGRLSDLVLRAGSPTAGDRRRMFLKFDVRALGGRRAAAATLRLRVAAPSGSRVSYLLALASSIEWDEDRITPTTAPAPERLIDVVTLEPEAVLGTEAVADLTDGLAEEGLYTFVLHPPDGTTPETTFSSSETSTPPTLEIWTVPTR